MKRHKLLGAAVLLIVIVIACIFRCPIQPNKAIGQEKVDWKTITVSSYRLGYQESFIELINSSMIKARLSDAEREFCQRHYERNLEIATKRFIMEFLEAKHEVQK